MEYLFIFLAKIVEVSLATIRTMFVAKGEKIYAALVGFFEVIIWLNVVSVVIIGISENPGKMFAYAIGFSLGTFVGVILESKLAVGLITIQAVVDNSIGKELAEKIRSKNVGVTIVNGEGMQNDKSILIIHTQRKYKDNVISQIENEVENAFVTISDVKVINGGFGLIKK